jgi:uncharacterized membrane protein YccC
LTATFSDRPRSIDRTMLRRGALFLAAIGIPLSIGVLRQEPAGALIGPVCGLLFSFADETGVLRRRLGIVLLCALGIAAGAAVGLLLYGFAWPIWPLFALACFATGQFNRSGKAATMATRLSAMAMVVTSGSPELTIKVVWYALLALAVAILTRVVDHALFGPMPSGAAPVRTPPPGGWTRFSVCYAAAAVVSLWVGISIDPARALWVVVTTLMVMQSDARLSYVRIVHRTTGTVIGVVVAFLLTAWLKGAWPIAAAILLLAPLIPHHLQRRYWLHTALIAVLVLLAYDLAAANMHVLRGLFTERLEDVALGAGIALVGTMIAFPRRAPDEPGAA